MDRSYPRYPYPPARLLPLVRDWSLGRPRNFQLDARTFSGLLGDSLRVSGLGNLVRDQPMVVVMNHYSRPGFGMWWLVVAIAACLPRNPHVIMTSELTRWLGPWGSQLSRWALPRIARMYGFSTMPPMPPRPQDVQARATAVRRVLRYIESTAAPLLMLAPEGRDNIEGGKLARPPAGVGRFLLLLASRDLSILPVGGWEADGALRVHFGSPFELSVSADLPADERDRQASRRVMVQIASLVPEELRGEFGIDVRSSAQSLPSLY